MMRTQHKILCLAILLGVLVWSIDAFLHSFIFSEGTLPEMLFTKVPVAQLYFRLILLFFFIVLGIITSRNFVKHQRAKEKLTGINRVLNVISEANKALVYAEEETALLKDICRITVNTGGYCLAWVGFLKQDNKKSVKSVAQWGEPGDFFETLNITGENIQSHQWPTGQVIQTGKPVIVRDTLLESRFKPWQEKVLKCGYRSSVTLPLMQYKQAFGVLNIYAAEPEAFNPEEIKLLCGLADDLAFGIDALRSRAYHQLAEDLIQDYYIGIAFLSQTIIELIGLSPEDDIFSYIGDQLFKLMKHAVILVSCCDKSLEIMELCHIIGNDHYAMKINKILGRNPLGMKFKVSADIKNTFCSPKLVQILLPENLSDVESINFPRPVLQQLIDLLEIEQIFSIGLQKEKMLFGNAFILIKRGEELKNTEVIETFIHQASIILHRRFIQRELEESENKFRLLAEITPGTIFIHRGKKIIYANQATKIITGYSMKELKQMNFWEIVFPPYQEKQKQLGIKLLKGQIPQNRSEIILEKKNGDKCWVQMISKSFDFEGTPAVMVTALDITEVKMAQEMEKRHQEQLMQADKMISLGNLVAGVAHEINNPINAIMVNTPVLMDIWEKIKPILDQYYKKNGNFEVGRMPYTEIPESVSDLYAGIMDSSKRIKAIVEDLKNFARPNYVELSPEVDINDVVKQSINLVHNMIVKATNNFSVKYGEDIPLIKGNPQQLEQVFINLFQNACQALETDLQAIQVITSYDSSIERVSVEVKDEGPGIPFENLKFIMDPLFTTKRKNGGTGLGLSVCSRIIQGHQGEINVESTVGKGSTFTVLLPVNRTENEKLEERGKNGEISAKSCLDC